MLAMYASRKCSFILKNGKKGVYDYYKGHGINTKKLSIRSNGE